MPFFNWQTKKIQAFIGKNFITYITFPLKTVKILVENTVYLVRLYMYFPLELNKMINFKSKLDKSKKKFMKHSNVEKKFKTVKKHFTRAVGHRSQQRLLVDISEQLYHYCLITVWSHYTRTFRCSQLKPHKMTWSKKSFKKRPTKCPCRTVTSNHNN